MNCQVCNTDDMDLSYEGCFFINDREQWLSICKHCLEQLRLENRVISKTLFEINPFIDTMKTVITKDEQRALLAYLEKIRKPKYTPRYHPDKPELYHACWYCDKQAAEYVGRADAYFCWECGQWKERNDD